MISSMARFILLMIGKTANESMARADKASKNNERAERILKSVREKYENCQAEFEAKKAKTNSTLKLLGKTKINADVNEMKNFVDTIKKFHSINYRSSIGADKGVEKNFDIGEMEAEVWKASEIVGGTAGALASGVLTGIAACGGVSVLGTASAGLTLTGLAAPAAISATVTWFAGGLGLGSAAAGGAILGGIMVAPVLAIGSMMYESKSIERLEAAKKKEAEIKQAIADMNNMNITMDHICEIAGDYNKFIRSLCKRFDVAIDNMGDIYRRHSHGRGSSKVDINDLSREEQEQIHLTVNMAQLLMGLLKKRLIDSEFRVDSSAEVLLENAKKNF